MIKINNLTKKYKKTQALKGITLNVRQNELFAYLGPNGSGKTTTINILTGLTSPTSGDVYLNNFHCEKNSIQAKRQTGLVSQRFNLDNELTVFENMDIHGRLFHMSHKERLKRTNELLDYIELSDKKDELIKHLSGGMKRRIMIARAMMHHPKIIFLDEPTVGLDPAIRRKIWSLIKKIQQNGSTIFLTTHYIEEAEFLANRVAFLNEGNIVTVDTPQNLMDKIGAWAVDEMNNGDMITKYFKNRQLANDYIKQQEEGFTIRRIHLEDVFITLTGKKVSQ